MPEKTLADPQELWEAAARITTRASMIGGGR